ncbi:hypothetical protein EBQ93_04205 [bacterium]|nr:hypothetical protein [bacterium]
MDFVNVYSKNGGCMYKQYLIIALWTCIFCCLYSADGTKERAVVNPLLVACGPSVPVAPHDRSAVITRSDYADAAGYVRDASAEGQIVMPEIQRKVFAHCFNRMYKDTKISAPLCIEKLKKSFETKHQHQSIEDLQEQMKRYQDDFALRSKVSLGDAVLRSRWYIFNTLSIPCDKKSKIFNLEYANLYFFLSKMKHKEAFAQSLHQDVSDAMASLCVMKKISLIDIDSMPDGYTLDLCNIHASAQRVILTFVMGALLTECIRKNKDIKSIVLRK